MVNLFMWNKDTKKLEELYVRNNITYHFCFTYCFSTFAK